jgi:hypothetical protein
MNILENIVILAAFIALGVLAWSVIIGGQQIITEQPAPLIPTKCDIQQALVDAGYDIGTKGVDGNIGDDSNKAWDQYEIDTFPERLKLPAP